MTPDQIDLLLDNIDLLWLPVTWLVVPKHHRLKALALVVTCLLSLRLQAEFIEWTGYRNGFLPWLHSAARTRGMVTYGIILGLFLLAAHFSPKTKSMVFFAITLTIYIFAFCLSLVVMAL